MTTPKVLPTTPHAENGASPAPMRALPAPGQTAIRPHKAGIWSWIFGIVFLLILIAAGYGIYRYLEASAAAQTASTAASATRPGGGRAIPVVAAQATRADMPLYINGVGTAQALNTVMLKTRIDGQLDKVAFEEGQMVQQDQLLAEIDPRPFQVQLEQTVAQQAKDQSALDNAKLDLQRYQTARDAVPQQQLDTAAAQVTQFEAAIKIDQAQIDSAKLQLVYTKITAPISGRIGLRNVDVGNMVHAADVGSLAVITQLQPISVVFTFAQDYLPQVHKAMSQEGKVPVLAYNSVDSAYTTLLGRGVLSALDNQIDMSSDTFKLKATFDNQDNALFPNQFVNVRLLVETRKAVVLVPTTAIQTSPQATFVYVIQEDKTVEQRVITAGPAEAGMTLIEKGLDEGELVATAGLDQLKDGTKVSVQSPDAAATSGSQPASRPATRGTRGRRGGSRSAGPENAGGARGGAGQ